VEARAPARRAELLTAGKSDDPTQLYANREGMEVGTNLTSRPNDGDSEPMNYLIVPLDNPTRTGG